MTSHQDAPDDAAGTGAAARFVGQRMPRTEDQRMITGHGQYIDDLNKPGMVHVAFVRSQVARGRIIGLDVTEARQAPGVIAVLTAAEINPKSQVAGAPADNTPRHVLADADVRFVGDLIAMVVAESRYLAEDAAELVSVDIEPDDPVVTAEQALAEGAPLVHRELPDNCRGVLPAAETPELDGMLRERAARVPRDVHPAPVRERADGDPRPGRRVGSRSQAARNGPGLPGRARRAGVLRRDAGRARRRHPHHHARCGRVVRAEGVPHPGGAGRRGGGHGPG